MRRFVPCCLLGLGFVRAAAADPAVAPSPAPAPTAPAPVAASSPADSTGGSAPTSVPAAASDAPAAPAATAAAAPDTPAVAAPLLTVHWTEVQPKRRMNPAFPQDAAVDEYSCTVRIAIDAAGSPSWVQPVRCEGEFLDAVVTSVMASSWYPLKQAGVPTAAQFTMLYRFVRN